MVNLESDTHTHWHAYRHTEECVKWAMSAHMPLIWMAEENEAPWTPSIGSFEKNIEKNSTLINV